jgi:hypothetical protein
MVLRPRKRFLVLATVISMLFSVGFVKAQNANSCAISGTITDSTGAVVPGAEVTITNQTTGLPHTLTSGASGYFTEESLPPGDYSVTTKMSGFKTEVITNIHLDPGQRRGVDMKLAVGNVGTSVTVEADAVAVQTESAEAGGTITAKEVQNIMLNGRNFQALLSVVPGVSNVNGANGFYQSGQGAITTETVVNGSSGEEAMYTIDGVYNNTSASDVTMAVNPTVDFVDEMRVLSDNYGARYGMAGRQILVSTKSGGEQYHGGMYGFERSNEYGTAHNYLQNAQTPLTSLHLTDWGLTVGGPFQIPKVFNTDGRRKLFFFVGADWKANHYANSLNTRNTFTSAMRTGDLSSEPILTSGATLNPYSTLDATHRAILDARVGGGTGSGAACIYQKNGAGNYNQILPKCMDSNTVALMNAFWPLPNYTSTTANYINTNPVRFSDNEEIYRGDYSPNDKNTITFRWLREEVAQVNSSRNYNDPAPNPNSVPYTPAANVLVRWQWNISPWLINNASFGVIWTKYFNKLAGTYTLPSGVNIAQAFPNADPLNRMPNIEVVNDSHGSENWFWMGIGALPTYSNDADQEVADDFTWIHHNHTFQAGFTFMLNQLNLNASGALPMGIFCFHGDFSGDSAADYLLGFLANASSACTNSASSGYEQTNLQRTGKVRNKWTEIYFQDDWKLNRRLTLNLGMRYTFITAPTLDGNQVSNFVPSAFSASVAPAVCPFTSGVGCANANWLQLSSTNQPLTSSGSVANLITGLVNAGQGVPNGFTNPEKGLFAPRLGFAYRLTNDGKMSLHGGAGFGYAQVGLLQTQSLLSNAPFAQSPTYNGTEFSSPTGSGLANPPGLQAPSATSSDYRPATLRNYSLTVERQVAPGGVLQVGYAGMTTQHIFTTGFDQNFQVNPSAYVNASTSAAFQSCIAAGAAAAGISTQPNSGFQFDPCINAGTVNSNYYRPYAGYGAISTGASFGVANYNALLVGFEEKTHNLTTHVSYTWSKSLGDINASGTQVAYSSSGSFQNARNPLGDYGRPDYDRPQEFVNSIVYSIPVFNHASNNWERSLLGGWSATSYFLMESGFAETPSYSTGLATRPNATGRLVRSHGTDGKPGQQPVYSYQAYSRPAYGFFGTASVGSLRAPKEVALHLSAEKEFAITERYGVKIGGQAFNILNHPNVISINSGWSPTSQGSFGMATAYGDPREMQFYARVNF